MTVATGSRLYVAHGEYPRASDDAVVFYCGLPVRAVDETDARARIIGVLGGTVDGLRETSRMPILDAFDVSNQSARAALELTAV